MERTTCLKKGIFFGYSPGNTKLYVAFLRNCREAVINFIRKNFLFVIALSSMRGLCWSFTARKTDE